MKSEEKSSKAVTEAMDKWIKERRQKEISMRQLGILDKGFDLGKIEYKKRSELYGEAANH